MHFFCFSLSFKNELILSLSKQLTENASTEYILNTILVAVDCLLSCARWLLYDLHQLNKYNLPENVSLIVCPLARIFRAISIGTSTAKSKDDDSFPKQTQKKKNGTGTMKETSVVGWQMSLIYLERNCFEVQISADRTEWNNKLMKNLTEK